MSIDTQEQFLTPPKRRWQPWLVLLIGVLLGTSLVQIQRVSASKQAAVGVLPLEDLRAFADVFGRIKKDYVESVDDT